MSVRAHRVAVRVQRFINSLYGCFNSSNFDSFNSMYRNRTMNVKIHSVVRCCCAVWRLLVRNYCTEFFFCSDQQYVWTPQNCCVDWLNSIILRWWQGLQRFSYIYINDFFLLFPFLFVCSEQISDSFYLQRYTLFFNDTIFWIAAGWFFFFLTEFLNFKICSRIFFFLRNFWV